MVKKVLLVRPENTRPDAIAASYVKAESKGKSPQPPTPPIGGGVGGSADPRENTELDVMLLLEAAARLSSADRQSLLDQLALQNQSSPSDRDVSMWSQAIAEALTALVGSNGESYGALLVRKYCGASVAWRPVREFMETAGFLELKVPERQSVYRMLAGLLVEHARQVARRSGAPLGPKLVAACASNVAGVFDDQFPGYIAAGLGPLVARRLCAGPGLTPAAI